MTNDRRQRLRLRVDRLDELAFDLGPGDCGEADGVRCETTGGGAVRALDLSADDRSAGVRRFETTVDGWVFEVSVELQARAILRERAGQGSAAAAHHGGDQVTAQIPGRVVRLWVAVGDTVEAGQRLLAIEAMKMENEVRAPRAGTIAAIEVAVDSSVELGDELLTVKSS